MKHKFFKYTIVVTTCIMLSACGSSNEIDATNADTLSDSLKTIAKDMTEQERQTFSQDVLLVYGAKRDGAEKLNTNRLYSKDYSMLFSAQGELAGLLTEIFQDMSLKASEELDGKSPSNIAEQAKKIRQDYYKSYKQRLKNNNKSLVARLETDQKNTIA